MLCISDFKITDKYYKPFVNLIKERYNNKQLIVSSNQTNLLNLPQLISSNNVNDLWKMCNTIETQVRNLVMHLCIQSEMHGPVLLSKVSCRYL